MGKRWFKHAKWPKFLVRLHTYTIISFALLLISGIALVTPLVHTVLIPYLPIIYQLHILLGIIFGVTLLTPFLRRLIPKGKTIRRLDWLLPIFLGTIIVVTGIMLWLVNAFPTSWRSAAFTWHGRVSYILGAWLIIHASYKAWGYRPKSTGINAKLEPERRLFLKWIGGGIAATAVVSIIDPVGMLNHLLQSSASNRPKSSKSTGIPRFGAYYTVVDGYPQMTLADYRLTVDGLVAKPTTFTFAELEKLPIVTNHVDFHCVTGWSVANINWQGIRIHALAQHVQPSARVKYVHFYSFDGAYTESLKLSEAYDPTVLLAHKIDGQPLPQEQGYPVRLVVPKMYGYKSIKWVNRVEFSDQPIVGYWEARGYPNEAFISTQL